MCHSKMRKAFTLMEMMISVVLIVIITLFLSQAITSMQLANISLKKHDDVEQNRSKIFTLLYKDMLSAKKFVSLPTKERRFSVLQMQTMNSLYNIAYPYVVYFVHSETMQLIRLESAYPLLLPIPYEQKQNVKANVILSGVSDFNLYLSGDPLARGKAKLPIPPPISKDKNTRKQAPAVKYQLLYLNAKSLKSPMVMELSQP